MNVIDILHFYGVRILEDVKSNPNIYCHCPFHKGSGKVHVNFSINRTNGKWICFSKSKKGDPKCGAGGLVRFVKKMENCSTREAKETLRSEFNQGKLSWGALIKATESDSNPKGKTRLRKVEWPNDFVLIPDNHPWIKKRRYDVDTFRAFNVAYDPSTPHLVHFPIYFRKRLRGFSARDIRKQSIHKWRHDKGVPRRKILYNFDESVGKDYVIVVEGPMDAMRLWSFGFHSVVSIFGTEATDEQTALLIGNWNKVFVAFDGDEPGRDGAIKLTSKLIGHVEIVARVPMPAGKDPDNLKTKEEFLICAKKIIQEKRRKKKVSWEKLMKVW
jgi:DNA primase